MTADTSYASPRPWKVKRAPWGTYLIMDANGEAIASMDEPAPERALANAALMAEGANALSAPRRNCEKFRTLAEAVVASGEATAEAPGLLGMGQAQLVRFCKWLFVTEGEGKQ